MAYKYLGLMNEAPEAQENQGRGFGNQLLQGGKEALTSLLGLPGSLYQSALEGQRQSISQQSPEYQKAFIERHGPLEPSSYEKYIPSGENIRNYLGHQHIAPETLAEKLGYNIGAAAPGSLYAALTGGIGALPLIAGSTLGGAAGEIAGEPVGEFAGRIIGGEEGKGIGKAAGGLIGSLLGSYGTNKSINAISRGLKLNPNDLVGSATKAQQEAYEIEKKIGRNVKGSSKAFDKKLENYQDMIRSKSNLSTSVQDELIKKAQETRNIAKEHQIIGSDLVQKKKDLNGLYRLPMFKDETNKNQLKQLQKIIFDEGDELGKGLTNKSYRTIWHNAWKEGDDITKVLRYGENLKDIAEETPGFVTSLKSTLRNPLAKAIGYGAGLGGSAYLGLFPFAAAGVGALETGRQAFNYGKYLSKFMEYPATRKLLEEATKQTINRQVPQLLRTYTKLNTLSEKYSKNHPEILEEVAEFNEPKKGKFTYLGVV